MTTRRQVRIKVADEPRDSNSDMKLPPQAPPQPPPPPAPSDTKPEPSIKEILAYPVLTPEEVAILFRVSSETVMGMVSDGTLPALKMKGHTRLLRIDVLRHIRDLRDNGQHPRRYSRSR